MGDEVDDLIKGQIVFSGISLTSETIYLVALTKISLPKGIFRPPLFGLK